jgi:leader peptidase (prepilin peptidase) / N-methyltransferase
MEATLIVIVTALGMVLASFLNVCIDRLPAKESILFPPSHCPACQERLRPKDLIPVFSYLRLRGRCRYCRAPIPRRILGLEITLGAIFPLLFWHYMLSPSLMTPSPLTAFGLTAFYCAFFITIFVIDLERGLILNRIVVPAMIAAILISVFLHGSIDESTLGFTWGSLAISLPPGIVSALIGGGVGFGITLLVIVASRGGMGFGDAKLAGLIGLVIGFPMIFFTLITAAILGGIVAGVLLALKKKRRKQAIPFGPMLSVATIITLLWGADILVWYLRLF